MKRYLGPKIWIGLFFVLLLTNNFVFGRETSGEEEQAVAPAMSSNFEVVKAEYGVFSDKPELYTNDKVVLLNTAVNKYVSDAGDAEYSKASRWQNDNLTNIFLQKVDDPEAITPLVGGTSVYIASTTDKNLYLLGWGLVVSLRFGDIKDTRAQWTVFKKTGGEPHATDDNIKTGDEVYFRSNHEAAKDWGVNYRYLSSYFAKAAASSSDWKNQAAVWKIFKAVKGEGSVDVTNKVKSLIDAGRSFNSSNDFFTDPAPGVAKWLKVTYRVSGEEKTKWFFQGTDVKFPELKKAVISKKIETVAPEVTTVEIKSAQYGVFAEKPAIWFGDKVSLENKNSNRFIALSERDGIRYVASWRGETAAALYLRLPADPKEIGRIKNKDTVLIESSAKNFLAIGPAYRQLIFSSSTAQDSQWVLIKRGSGSQNTINDNDEILVQNKGKPSQYLFTYFNQFPVHDSKPADPQSIYIIKKSVEGDGLVDVTDKLRDLMSRGKSIKVSNLISGVSDPAPGLTKFLKIEYTFAGKDFTKWVNASLEKTVNLGVSTEFRKISGPVSEISLGFTRNGETDIWGIHALGAIYRWDWDNNSWKEVDSKEIGKAQHIANCKSSGVVLCTNVDKNVFKYKKDGWVRIKGQADRIAIGDAGSIYAIFNGVIYKATDPAAPVVDNLIDMKWSSVPLVAGDGSKALEISVGSDGSVWYLSGKKNLYRRQGESWVVVNKKLKKIFIGDSKNVWGIDDEDNLVFSSDNGKTWQTKGKNFISGSADGNGNVFLIASTNIGGGVYTNVDIVKEAEKIKQSEGAKAELEKLQTLLEQAKKDNDTVLVKKLQSQIAALRPEVSQRRLEELQRRLKNAQKLGDEKLVAKIEREIQQIKGAEVKSELTQLKEKYERERAKSDPNVEMLLRLRKKIAALETEQGTIFDNKLKKALEQKEYQDKINALELLIKAAGASGKTREKYVDALKDILQTTTPENLVFLKDLIEKVKTDSNFAQDENAKDALDNLSEDVSRRIKVATLEREAQTARLLGEKAKARKIKEQIEKLKRVTPVGEVERLRTRLAKEAAKPEWERDLKKMKALRTKIDELQAKEKTQTAQNFQAEVARAKKITDFNEKIEKFKELLSVAVKTKATRKIYVDALAELVAYRTPDQLEKLQELLRMAMYNTALIGDNTERKTFLSELYTASQSTVTRLEIIKDLQMLLGQEKFTPEQREMFVKDVNTLFNDAIVMTKEELDAFIEFLNAAMKSPHFVAQKDDIQKMLDVLQGEVPVSELIDLLKQRYTNKLDVKTEYDKQAFINALRYVADQIIKSKNQGINITDAEKSFVELLRRIKNDYSYPLNTEQRKQVGSIIKDVRSAISVPEPTESSSFSERLDYLYKLVTKDTFATSESANNYISKITSLIAKVDSAGDIEKNKFADMLNFLQIIPNITPTQKNILKSYHDRLASPKSLQGRIKSLTIQANVAIGSTDAAANFVLKLQKNLNDIITSINEGKAPAELAQLISTLKTVKNTSAFIPQKAQIEDILSKIEKKKPEEKKPEEKKPEAEKPVAPTPPPARPSPSPVKRRR
ncbi:hypothetical protein K9L05_02180 [Candidatus Babeliales bacterium]|nr:hypothetical protein [Candidatus Babeliales bacterium]MCF7899437.1 hypothetical protein [Candidatus Babeliales bacterium]